MFRCLIRSFLWLAVALPFCAGAGAKSAWQQFSQCRTINCQAFDDSIVWIGTDECGLARLSPLSGRMSFLTNCNSGLPSNSVNCLAAGRDHVLWIGTDEGLAAFDGRAWRVFTAANSPFPSNSVSSVAIDSSGGVWAGFGSGGVAVYSSSGWTNLLENRPGYPLALALNTVWTIAPVNAHDAWISWNPSFEDSYCFALLNDNGWHAYGYGGYRVIRWTASDKTGALWFGSSEYAGGSYAYGFTRLQYPDSLTTYFPPSSLYSSASPTAVAIDTAGRKWAGVGNGVVCFNDTTWTRPPLIQDTTSAKGSVSSIVFDKAGTVWAGFNRTDMDPVVAWLSGVSSWTLYPMHGSELQFNDIRFICPSKNSAAWIGGQGYNHVMRFDSGVGAAIPFLDSIFGDSYYTISICPDGSGGIWISRSSGFIHGDGNQWKVFDLPTPLAFSPGVVYTDAKGVLWAGMSGLSRRPYAIGAYTKACSLIEMDSSLSSPVIGITSAADGTMWAAITNAGLRRRTAEGSWTQVTKANSGLASDSVTGILAGPDGKVWVGTKNCGIACLSNGQWKSFDTLNSDIPGQYTKPLCFDSSGNLWLLAMPINKKCTYHLSYSSSIPVMSCYDATVPNGIVKFDGVRWAVYNTINSGLPSNTVYTAAVGDSGRLWVGTDKGIAMYNAGIDAIILEPRPHAAAGYESQIRIYVRHGIVTIHAQSWKITSVLFVSAAGRTVPVIRDAPLAGGKSTLSLSRLSPGLYIARMSLLSVDGHSMTLQRHFVVPGK